MSVTLDGVLAFNVVFLAFNFGVAAGLFLKKSSESKTTKRKKRKTSTRPATKSVKKT